MTRLQPHPPQPHRILNADGTTNWRASVEQYPETPKSRWEASKIAVGLEVVREKRHDALAAK